MVSTTQTGGWAAEGTFPSARRGYDRAAVDEAVSRLRSQLGHLQQQADSLAQDNRRLHEDLGQANTRAAQVDYSGLGGRAQEILRIAEEQARDVTLRAEQDADQLAEATETETERLRAATTTELAELRSAQLAELAGLRAQGQSDAAALVERARAESAELQAAGRLY
ncbi:MAG: putative cellulose-binding protein, partial [Friedmanniella sp.]|nr:putative cellulose-binding protein [Friedmanniella sp.]